MKLRKLTTDERPPILLALAGVLGIGPMAVFRLIEGNMLVAAIDSLFVGLFSVVVWLVYVKRSTRVASVVMAFVALGTALISVNIQKGAQVIWMHPTTVALFYLLKPREAAIVSVFAIAAITPALQDGRTGSEIAVVLASLVVTIALSIAFAALTAQQRRELHATSLRDPLTNTGNRRALDETLDSSIDKARTERQTFFMIMLDIDHFKSINDRFGHAVGDDVLREVAETIKANIRPTDSCFRAGGEEFVVLAGTPDLSLAKRLGERLRAAIEDMRPATSSGAQVSVTASLGLAEYVDGETRDALYKRADDALYSAKRAGRNRLQLSDRLTRSSAA